MSPIQQKALGVGVCAHACASAVTSLFSVPKETLRKFQAWSQAKADLAEQKAQAEKEMILAQGGDAFKQLFHQRRCEELEAQNRCVQCSTPGEMPLWAMGDMSVLVSQAASLSGLPPLGPPQSSEQVLPAPSPLGWPHLDSWPGFPISQEPPRGPNMAHCLALGSPRALPWMAMGSLGSRSWAPLSDFLQTVTWCCLLSVLHPLAILRSPLSALQGPCTQPPQAAPCPASHPQVPRRMGFPRSCP